MLWSDIDIIEYPATWMFPFGLHNGSPGSCHAWTGCRQQGELADFQHNSSRFSDVPEDFGRLKFSCDVQQTHIATSMVRHQLQYGPLPWQETVGAWLSDAKSAYASFVLPKAISRSAQGSIRDWLNVSDSEPGHHCSRRRRHAPQPQHEAVTDKLVKDGGIQVAVQIQVDHCNLIWSRMW